jgi:tetratricopeptide (TPR) repeat protein
LGLLAWLAPLIGVFYLLWRGRGDAERRLVAWSLGVGAVLLWVMMALYVPSPNLLLLAFALAGGVVGLLGASGRTATRPVAVVTVLLVLAALAWTGLASTRRSVAEAYVGQAAQALSAGDLKTAQSYTDASLAIERMPENLRLAVAVGGSSLTQIAAQPAGSSTQQTFTDTLSKTIAYGQEAIAKDPLDYRSYLALGQVYDLLAQNKVEGAYDSAKAAYTAAAQRNPTNPTIPLLIARLEGAAGTAQGLTDALKQSLTLKPDYTDAILFLAQVDIARKDIGSAINDTKVAAGTAPGVPSIWYELGLLYYANNDAKDAVPALEQALALQADYANAQYYLGLSYAALGRTQDAIGQFERLNQTNGGNAQVAQILANLKDGKAPLSTSTPAQ